MLTSDPQAEKYGTTARLFAAVSHLPRDQQLILLKQMIGDRVTEHLFKLIVEMTESQQSLLLEQIGHSPEVEPEETTVRLEGNEPGMRENPRKTCLINADYRIKGRHFRSYILDISIGGVFVETADRFPVGEEIMLNFSLPNQARPYTIPGKIAWSGPRGFGVKFERVPDPLGPVIGAYVAQGK
jgi:hypothetical protein